MEKKKKRAWLVDRLLANHFIAGNQLLSVIIFSTKLFVVSVLIFECWQLTTRPLMMLQVAQNARD